jgi:hypothetical protein
MQIVLDVHQLNQPRIARSGVGQQRRFDRQITKIRTAESGDSRVQIGMMTARQQRSSLNRRERWWTVHAQPVRSRLK